MGYTINDADMKVGTIELEGVTLPTLEFGYDYEEGSKVYQKQAYATGDNGNYILTFTATSADQAMLDTMLKGIKAQ